MESNQILSADVLDIVFEGRNKAYGAYQLRKTYSSRLTRSILIMLAVILLLVIGNMVLGRDSGKNKMAPLVDDVTLETIQEKKVEPVVIPPAPKVEVKVEIKQFTPPRIVKEDVKPDEKPPEQDDLDKVKIGAVNQKGDADDGLGAPPG